MARAALAIIMIALIVALVAVAAVETAGAATTPKVRIDGPTYLRGLGLMAPTGRYDCWKQTAEQDLQTPITGTTTAWVKNTVRWCWTLGGAFVSGSVSTFPDDWYISGYSDGGRRQTLGYATGYKATRRNACAFVTIYFIANGFPLHKNLSARWFGNGATQSTVMGSGVTCYTNIFDKGW
jgi:hypothetical protein